MTRKDRSEGVQKSMALPPEVLSGHLRGGLDLHQLPERCPQPTGD